MEPEMVRLLLDAGIPSALLAIVIAMQWRRRNGNGGSAEQTTGAVFFEVRALGQDMRDFSRRLNDFDRLLTQYESANERANRERHEEVVAAIDVLHRDVRSIKERSAA